MSVSMLAVGRPAPISQDGRLHPLTNISGLLTLSAAGNTTLLSVSVTLTISDPIDNEVLVFLCLAHFSQNALRVRPCGRK